MHIPTELITLLALLFGVLSFFLGWYWQGKNTDKQIKNNKELQANNDLSKEFEKLWNKCTELDKDLNQKCTDIEKDFNKFKTYAAGNYVQQTKLTQELKDLKAEIKDDFNAQDELQKQRFDELTKNVDELKAQINSLIQQLVTKAS